MRRLAGRTAIVTGAGAGIGAAIARRFAAEGADVVLAEIDADAGAGLAAALRDTYGVRAEGIETDIAAGASVEAMVARTVALFGGVDILVNNAGIAVFGDPLALTDAEWQRCLSVDLDGAWRCCRAVLPHRERDFAWLHRHALERAPFCRRSVYDFDIAAGTIANKRDFARFDRGVPDGSTVDAEGYLWNARWGGHCVVRFAPDGSVDRVIELPVSLVTSVAFGGPDLKTLYVTTARYGLRPEERARQPLAGHLFACEPGAVGLAATPCAAVSCQRS